MKRRNFCKSIAIGSACFAGIVGKNLAFATSSQSTQTKSHYEWVILYWMPYDNNLVKFGEPIIEMLIRGTQQNPKTAVVVQSDYWGHPRMRRRHITNGTVTEINIAGEDSSDVSALAAYLDWAYQTFEAEHWAIIVVGHGGKINEISPDDHRINGQVRTWMRVDRFANAVSHFNQATQGRVELLFFQNCHKATLEVVYEARNCAQYTLASQLLLGAPNYYYEGFLNRLKSVNDGREAAIAIMDSERADMYHTLTLVNNKAVNHIPEKLSSLLQPILGSDLAAMDRSDIPTYYYSGEQHCDALALLGYLATISGEGQSKLAEFSNFLNSSVIAAHKTDGEIYGRLYEDLRKLCGLSLYFPDTAKDISRYSSLALSQKVDFVDLYSTLTSA
jgi:hypothetical protein